MIGPSWACRSAAMASSGTGPRPAGRLSRAVRDRTTVTINTAAAGGNAALMAGVE
jgi:delta 1-pyrroline-5-carboxylate dehydrogenase